MSDLVQSPYLVRPGEPFRVADAPAAPPDGTPAKRELNKERKALTQRLGDLQRVLYAQNQYAVLLVFQAMDAAGKDGTIRAVLSGVNPAGCQVSSFKAPSENELAQDFLWRTTLRLPQRGRIGVFNRSHYEEVLVVRVHPEFLAAQRLPDLPYQLDELWAERYASINAWERHLARNGTVILKFWLNVSPEEQRKRFLSRIEEPAKNWKFSLSDVRERGHWDAYMEAYEAALSATSTAWAPWYAIPADDKAYMRRTVAQIVVERIESLGLSFPDAHPDVLERLDVMRDLLGGSD